MFQVALFFQNMTSSSIELDNLAIEPVDVDVTTTKFDLQFTVTTGEDGGSAVAIDYAVDLFDEATVRTLAERFLRILDAATVAPDTAVGDLPVLSAQEQQRMVVEPNRTERHIDHHLLLDGFEARVAASPHAVALVLEGEELTYAEFDARVTPSPSALSLSVSSLRHGSRWPCAVPSSWWSACTRCCGPAAPTCRSIQTIHSTASPTSSTPPIPSWCSRRTATTSRRQVTGSFCTSTISTTRVGSASRSIDRPCAPRTART